MRMQTLARSKRRRKWLHVITLIPRFRRSRKSRTVVPFPAAYPMRFRIKQSLRHWKFAQRPRLFQAQDYKFRLPRVRWHRIRSTFGRIEVEILFSKSTFCVFRSNRNGPKTLNHSRRLKSAPINSANSKEKIYGTHQGHAAVGSYRTRFGRSDTCGEVVLRIC